MLCSPRSRMDVLTEQEINALLAQSKLVAKYNQAIDSQSAYEILTIKLKAAAETATVEEEEKGSKKSKGRTKRA